MNFKVTLSEYEIVASIKENNKQGFDYLYRNYGAALSVVIGKIISDQHTAEDLLQETFINIWANINQYNPEKGRLYTWMRNIATNKCRDFLRCSVHNMRSRTTGKEEEIDIKTEQKTEHIGVNQLVAKLDVQHQTLICMAYYRGHTFEEMSNQLNIPMGTVKSRMRKALGILRNEFAYAS